MISPSDGGVGPTEVKSAVARTEATSTVARTEATSTVGPTEATSTAGPTEVKSPVGPPDGDPILAAGALPWRRRRGELQVALVHRPRYDDWSWAKGKLDPGEEWAVAAVREVFEETGLHVRLGRPLPSSRYTVLGRGSQPVTKEVRYWSAEVVGGDGTLLNEIDQVDWLDVTQATARLSYDRDVDQLRALVDADRDGSLTTWPLVIVRHAKAASRSSWTKPDPLRPLDSRGRKRSEALVPILASYGVTRVVSSPSVRCVDTVMPFAVAVGERVRLKEGLSEEGFAAGPERSIHNLHRLIERGHATVVSSHGPVLPTLLEWLAAITRPGGPGGDPAKVILDAAQRGMAKGEALVAHLVGTGAEARVVDVEICPPT